MVRLALFLRQNVVILALLYLLSAAIDHWDGTGLDWTNAAIGGTFWVLAVIQLYRRRQQNLPWIG